MPGISGVCSAGGAGRGIFRPGLLGRILRASCRLERPAVQTAAGNQFLSLGALLGGLLSGACCWSFLSWYFHEQRPCLRYGTEWICSNRHDPRRPLVGTPSTLRPKLNQPPRPERPTDSVASKAGLSHQAGDRNCYPILRRQGRQCSKTDAAIVCDICLPPVGVCSRGHPESLP